MIRRLVEAWVRTTEIRSEWEHAHAEARVEAARVQADAALEIARLQILPDVEEDEHEIVPPDVRAIEEWSQGVGHPEQMTTDVVGMYEAVRGYVPATAEDKRKFADRLARLGAPV